MRAPLWEEAVDHVLLPENHPLAREESLTVPRLASLPLVIAEAGYPSPLRRRGLSLFQGLGLQSPLLSIDGGLHAAHLAVAMGRGWTPVVHSLSRAAPQGTRAVPLEGLDLSVLALAMWRSGERRPVVRTVLEAAFEVARRHPRTKVAARPRNLPPARVDGSGRRVHGTVPCGLAVRQLRAIQAMARAETIGRAASRLGISQSALSRQLTELEAASGLQLLERSARGATLTPAGRSLADDCERLVASLERLAHETERARRAMERRLVIGAVTTPAAGRLLGLLSGMITSVKPPIQVVIEDVPSPQQVDALLAGDIDIGLGHPFLEPGRDKHLRRERLIEDNIDSALLPVSHSLAGHASLQAADLAELPFLFMNREFNPVLHDRLLAALTETGLVPRIVRRVDSLYAMWTLTAQGEGWSLGFRSQRERPPMGTVAVPVAGLDVSWGIDMLTRSAEPSPTTAVVADLMRQAGQGRPALSPPA